MIVSSRSSLVLVLLCTLCGCGGSGPDLAGFKHASTALTRGSPRGAATALAVSGDFVYAGSNQGLNVMQFSGGALTSVAEFDMRPPTAGTNYDNTVTALRVVGTTLIVGGRTALYGVDVSKPSAPAVVTTVTLTTDPAAIHGNGNVAAMVDNTNLYLFDVANGGVITERSRTQVAGFHVYVDGKTAYVSGTSALTAYDISDLGAPKVLGTLPNRVAALEPAGNGQLFNAEGNAASPNRALIDVSNKAEMKTVSAEFSGDPWSGENKLVRIGNTLYTGGNGMKSYDVGDPLKPKFLTQLTHIGDPAKTSTNVVQTFELIDNRLYVAHAEGVTVYTQ